MPAQSLQIEFLNKWRNAKKYGDDPQAPNQLSFDYLFAIAVMAQPLAWFEASGLPQKAFETAPIIKKYNKLRNKIHTGTILPIGNESNGYEWTGFQSIVNDKEGYFMVYREQTDNSNGMLKTWLKEGDQIKLTKQIGEGEKQLTETVYENGNIKISLPANNSFVLYKYQIK